MKNVYQQATDAVRDAEQEYVRSGGDEAKANAEAACPCCVGYDRKGFIWNAGAWMRCPMCNPSFVGKP